MKELKEAIAIKAKYNKMDLEDVVKEFEEYSGQEIPQEAIDRFKYVGLNHVDFLTSDWLNNYGLLNLLQFEES